jgi:predicted component of type VI protein secretion system
VNTFRRWFAGLAMAALFLVVVACHSSVKAPPMPQVPNPPPAAGASALEVERYQLVKEKQALESSYGDNLGRIKQINTRLIEINIELNQHGSHP